MIAYTEQDYTFLNYKDSVQSLTPLFKIVGYKKEHIEIPTLSDNSIIVWNTGKTVSTGNPYPGGRIYLQNDYAAIDYDKNKVGFELVISMGFKPNEKYTQILPTKNYSTALSRILCVPPTKLIFVKGGVIAEYPDAIVNGISADYIALDSGEPFAAFNVHSRTYPCLPFPNSLNTLKKLAFISRVYTSAENAMYHTVNAVDGLKTSPELKSYIQTCRQQMLQYESLDIDVNKACSFAAPVSDALLTDGLIFSALSTPIARAYISDKEELKQDPSKDFCGLVLKEDHLVELICNPPEDFNSLFEYVKGAQYLPAGAMILLNSEFNSILALYNDTYRKYQKIAAMSALKRMKSDAAQALNLLIEKSPSVIQDIFDKYKNTKGFEIMKGASLSTEAKFSAYDYMSPKLSVLSWDPDNKEEDANIYKGYLSEYIDFLGNDCQLTDEEFDALANTPMDDAEEAFAIELIHLGLLKDDSPDSILRIRLIATLINNVSGILKRIAQLSKAKTINTSGCVYTREDRGRYFPRLNKNLDIKMFGDAPFHLSIKKITITNSVTLIDYVASCDSIDMDMRKWMDDVKNRLTQEFRDKITIGDLTVNLTLSDSICGCSTQAWNNVRTFDRAKNWDGQYITTYVSGTITVLNTIGAINLTTVSDAINNDELRVYYPEAIQKLTDNAIRVEQIKKKMSSVIDIFASNVAYELVGYLFESCKDNYEFEALGVIGTSYDGIPVLITELAYVSGVSVEYVNGILRLIDESPMDDTLRNKLGAFRQSLLKASAVYQTAKPIYYLTKDSVNSAGKSANINAFYHYLYGAI